MANQKHEIYLPYGLKCNFLPPKATKIIHYDNITILLNGKSIFQTAVQDVNYIQGVPITETVKCVEIF